MPKEIARITVTMNDDGLVEVEGFGAPLKHKAYAFGLLELAKDVIRGNGRTLAAANSLDLAQFSKSPQ